jgi:hypothetical protein
MEIRRALDLFFILLREHIQERRFKGADKRLFVIEIIVHRLIEHIHHVITLDIKGNLRIDGV